MLLHLLHCPHCQSALRASILPVCVELSLTVSVTKDHECELTRHDQKQQAQTSNHNHSARCMCPGNFPTHRSGQHPKLLMKQKSQHTVNTTVTDTARRHRTHSRSTQNRWSKSKTHAITTHQISHTLIMKTHPCGAETCYSKAQLTTSMSVTEYHDCHDTQKLN